MVTFKRSEGIEDENFNILGVHWKIQLLGGGGGFTKKKGERGDCLRRGAGQFANQGGDLKF